ncbi:MAG: DUF1549 domain-containing protein [Gemmataceae bacterium]|nr:DUF1549 domain-containing protein [Gemmataceae bacterium]
MFCLPLLLLAFLPTSQAGFSQQPNSPIAEPAWKNLNRGPLQPGEIDTLLEKELSRLGKSPAPLCSDADFLRRVCLDMTGRPPTPEQSQSFLSAKSPNKRQKLLDDLLESDDHARFWAMYWGEVIQAKVTDRRAMLAYRPFEDWMTQQVKKNTPWDQVARDLICAEGQVMPGEPANGQTFLMLAHLGPDAPVDRAAEVSRIFLGMQIQCAQCHDHPSDIWKREQFHHFAAYFARTSDRLVFAGNNRFGLRVVSKFFGEHQMPLKDDPSKSTRMNPKFLDGQEGPKFASDVKRREDLAKSIVDKNNPWFAAAYVNRVWGKLLGQGFYQPIDDMGPQKEAVQHAAFLRLVGAFQGGNYNPKEFLRAVAMTRAYQRETRLGQTQDEHLLFSAVYPARLPAISLWQELTGSLGQVGGASMVRVNPLIFARSYEGMFRELFKFDPSANPDEVEGGVAQALWLMNSPQIEEKIRARGFTLLGKILQDNPDNSQALKAIYQRVLSREPTAAEVKKCLEHVKKAPDRAAGFEDVLWALINSTEFQTRR